jgi:D-glycero-D-manno-heptose 1,7-bisphosphate phosphatase
VAVVLITNQSGIARGLMSRETVDRIHETLEERLAFGGAHLDGIYLCPHLPAERVPEGEAPCDCRKPATGLVDRARRELGLGGLPSLVVGDKPADLGLAENLGVPALLVLTGEGEGTRRACVQRGEDAPDSCPNLAMGVPWILQRLGIA